MQNRCSVSLQCCQNCRSLCDEEFKQVINLKKSGLLIYIYNKDSLQKRNIEGQRSIILYNYGQKELKRFDYIAELCQYKTKCFKCKALIENVRCLIDNLSTINKNEVLGVCEYCKRSPKNNKCKKCNYLMYKFLNNETKRDLENKIRFNDMICTLRQVFMFITQGLIICKHNIYLDSESKIQLDNLLKHLNWPVTSRQPNIGHLVDFFNKENKGNNIVSDNEKISDIITKNKSENSKNSILEDDLVLSESRSACICKYLLNDKIKKSSLFEKNSITEDTLSPTLYETKRVEDIKLKKSLEELLHKLTELKVTANTTPNMPNVFPKLKLAHKKILGTDIRDNKMYKNKNSFKEPKGKTTKLFPGPDNEMILKMMKQKMKVKDEMRKKSLLIKNEEHSRISDLSVIETFKSKGEYESEKSESIVECVGDHPCNVSEIIKGTKLVPYNRHYIHDYHNVEKLPILFQIQEDDFKLPELSNNKSFYDYTDAIETNIRKTKRDMQPVGSGTILYQLSNREFIDKGWTKLPTTKVMRKMNIYKMIPSYSKFDWFKNHKDQKILYYENSTEKLAEIYENGCGKWFYKNGNLALEYYSTPELNSGKRCVIYSSDNKKYLKKKRYINILACFDYLGNGVVYDNYGNVRIKFNQSEGLVIDKKIGPPGRWRWHTLNEPPVLYPVFFNTFLKEPYRKDFKNSFHVEEENDKMIDIELDNLRKEKAAKIRQEYKSIQIRIKIVKINDYFTLRIINQAKIYLQFRYERICLKVNVGMLLKNEEILDTNIAEVFDVSHLTISRK